MKVNVTIQRQDGPSAKSYRQTFQYDGTGNDSVADFLQGLFAESDHALTIDGEEAGIIAWECSCRKKKCGACSMLVNGQPRLACDTFLRDYPQGVLLQPLSKFKLVKDLVVDRSVAFEAMADMGLWVEQARSFDVPGTGSAGSGSAGSSAPGGLPEQNLPLQEKAGACLQCGLCLEACANYHANRTGFAGPMAVPAAFGVLDESVPDEHREDVRKAYLKQFLFGCGQSLACERVCPAKLPLSELQAHANHFALHKPKR